MSENHTRADKLIKSYSIISDQMDKKRLKVILSQLEKVLLEKVEGSVVEFGCFAGTTSLFIRRLLDEIDSTRDFHTYDSFEGLPQKSIEDASVAGSDFKAGELKATKHDFVRNFKKAGLKLPYIHKGWFSELKPKELPEQIAFAFLDGDFYQSILDSLELVWPRMSAGGVVVVDDYMRSNLPGATRAVEEFFNSSRIKIRQLSNLAIAIRH